MPIEEIRRLQKEREAQAEAARVAAENERLQREKEEQLRRKKQEERNQFIKRQTDKILRESLVLDSLMTIEKELLEGNVAEHDVVYDPSDRKAMLVWGSNFKVVNGKIATLDSYNYSYIEVVVDPDTEAITIFGREQYHFDKHQWNKKQNIDKALAKAYMEPKRAVYSPPSSDREDNSGCCCGPGG